MDFPQAGLLELLAVALAIRNYDNATLAESLGVSDGVLPYQLDIFGIVQHGAIFRS